MRARAVPLRVLRLRPLFTPTSTPIAIVLAAPFCSFFSAFDSDAHAIGVRAFYWLFRQIATLLAVIESVLCRQCRFVHCVLNQWQIAVFYLICTHNISMRQEWFSVSDFVYAFFIQKHEDLYIFEAKVILFCINVSVLESYFLYRSYLFSKIIIHIH